MDYVESVDGSKADSLHRRIKLMYEEDLKHCYDEIVRWAVKKLRVSRCVLAFDTTKELYWGKNGRLNVRQIKHERGADEAFEWLVVSIVKPVPIMLMALPYRQGDDLAVLTIDLLNYVQTLNLNVDAALFDRGFYNGHLIDYLEAKRLNYLILVPENDKMKEYAKKTEDLKVFQHEMSYKKDKSSWKPTTRIVVIKDVKKGDNLFDLFFATNLAASYGLLRLYPKRWQIETNFRVMDQVKIKSKSNVYIIRYFYFMVEILLHTAWNITKRLVIHLGFKKYLRELAKQLLTASQAVT